MESAIPQHLRCPRTRAARASEDYTPPYPAWVARFNPTTTQVVMAYFGVQSRGGRHKALAALQPILDQLSLPNGPRHHDLAHHVDAQGYDTVVAIAYWDTLAPFHQWAAQTAVDGWWQASARFEEGVGYFREIFLPHVERFETLFSTPDKFEGVGVLASHLSGDIQEHGYWGGMRDRLPASQTDALGAGQASAGQRQPGPRVIVQGRDNVALIRSGQDWGETEGEERSLYLADIEPELRAGMDFLEQKGDSVGCHFNRYMHHIDRAGQPIEKSFGLSLWRTLEHMERWSESHPTHIAIFGTFMRVVQQMNFQLKLRLYHEVLVAKANEQMYEYVNCHPNTGVLRMAHAQTST
ncbi:phenylacetaldoxime dehydratase family protein [Hydrogenophaga sp.]|uniref:phenylacetaldoxime dehydratase family protein n=1 Tax=Hydrogenophaga sp. TaxID=1904254 RepID=UPI00272F6C75|nr:phenylacetaldoxime dehydratase family protein [Hydrogenophaga sp.]MDP2072796.1 phenylacetaldoxime dehydratase family protein [Hydrogenophaga sp.]MDP3108589.1 phenylacetaldoxime dehydratase family protein [Hydrogenophaga sp.]MDZ4399781.1 phenylacetaldoxime dehydratase family protein [Hydrogenophaga sp.]